MIKEIKLGGITTTPDDYLSQDGQAQYAYNIQTKNRSLCAPPTPTAIMQLPAGYSLIYIHHTLTGDNYIFINDATFAVLWSSSVPETSAVAELPVITTLDYSPLQVTAVGNMICIATSAGLTRLLFKDGDYITLTHTLPMPHFSAALNGEYCTDIYDNEINIAKSIAYEIYSTIYASHTFTGASFPKEDSAALGYYFDTLEKYIVSFETGKSELFSSGNYKVSVSFDITNYTSKIIRAQCAGKCHIFIGNTSEGGIEWTEVAKESWAGSQKSLDFFFSTPEDIADFKYIGINIVQYTKDSSITSYIYDPIDLVVNMTASVYKSESVPATFHLKYDVNDDPYQSITAAARKFILTKATEKHRFINPFLLRVAFKCADGNYISPSAPVLLIPNTGQVPLLRLYNIYNAETEDDTTSQILSAAAACDIRFSMPSQDSFALWKDYIQKVVIAITPPIESFDQSVTELDQLKSKIYIKDYEADESRYSVAEFKEDISQKYTENELYHNWFSDTDQKYEITLPDYDDYEEQLTRKESYYIIKEIPFDDIIDGKWAEEQTLDLKEIDLNQLVNRISLPDDNSSLQNYMPQTLYSYNGRLHMANYQQEIFSGWHPDQMFPTETSYPSHSMSYYHYKAYVYIKQDNTTYKVECPFFFNDNENKGFIRYFSYPNANAYQAEIYRFMRTPDGYVMANLSGSKFQKATLSLKSHPLRNEAYWFDGYNTPEFSWIEKTDTAYAKLEEDYESAISDTPTYTPLVTLADRSCYMKISEPNNPVLFTDARTYNFDSAVLAITSAVTALSQGQVGDFDLYVFTKSDGVWTLKINAEGGYSKQIPVSRDTLTNANSVCQLDGSVLFATSRGMMQLTGSQTECISLSLDRPASVSINDTDLPCITSLLAEVSGISSAVNGTQTLDFCTYVQKANCLYDYRNQRILIYQPAASYMFALSLSDQSWTLLPSTLKASINSYPESYCSTTDNKIIDMSGNSILAEEEQIQKPSFLLTRPFSIDDTNDHKTIDLVRINGTGKLHSEPLQGEGSHASMMLFGSNDLEHWQLLNTSREGNMRGRSGTPYRFFRLAIASQLLPLETIDSVTISYRAKSANSNLY